MRILQVVSLLTPDGAFGGPARVALNQTGELVRRGHAVTLVAATRGYPTALEELDGVPVRLFPARTVIPGAGFPGVASPGLARWVRAHAREYDVVHVHFGRDLMVLPVAAIVRGHHVPYVLQTHGMVIPSTHPLAGPLDTVWTRKLLADARAVLYLTDVERDQLRDVARADVRLIQLLNGVPAYPLADPLPGVPEVLFVARLHARKRPVAFVAMAKQLLRDGVDARFALIGPDEGEGAAVRAAIGDESRITWAGPLDPAAIPQRLAMASAYVLPSEREPYPMSVLEAMSVGLPVVVCDDCGLASAIAETGSGIVTSGATTSLADAVTTVLADQVAYGQRARKTVERDFGMAAIGDRLITIYQRAAS